MKFRIANFNYGNFPFRAKSSVCRLIAFAVGRLSNVHADDLADDGEHSHPAILHGPAVLDIAPGETATITYIFGESGTMLIGCHEPGHYEDGMVATIDVS